MRPKLTFILLVTIDMSLLAFARMGVVSTDVESRVVKSDAVIYATCLDNPEPREIVFLNPVRDVWKEVKWQYEVIDFLDGSTQQVEEYREALRVLKARMESAKNSFAVRALEIELVRHQREYRIRFKVEEVLKGYLQTNEVSLWYSSEDLSQTNSPFFKVGKQYFLYLRDRYQYQGSEYRGLNFFPLDEIWNPTFFQFTQATTNYFVINTGATLIDLKPEDYEERTKAKDFQDYMSLNHTQYVGRIRTIIEGQHLRNARERLRTD